MASSGRVPYLNIPTTGVVAWAYNVSTQVSGQLGLCGKSLSYPTKKYSWNLFLWLTQVLTYISGWPHVSHIARDDLKLQIRLPSPRCCWDYRGVPQRSWLPVPTSHHRALELSTQAFYRWLSFSPQSSGFYQIKRIIKTKSDDSGLKF